MPSKNKNIKIFCDTREQTPFPFTEYPCEVIPHALPEGDYSVAFQQPDGSFMSIPNGITIERKTLSDLVGCLTKGRERFEAELARMKPYESCAVVVESPFTALMQGRYPSEMKPYAAVQSVLSLTQKYRVPFIWGESRRQAEFITFHLLRHFYKHHGGK